MKIEPNIKRIQRDIDHLAKITSEDEKGFTRLSFSKEDMEARKFLTHLMQNEAGQKVTIDPAGNLIGRSEGAPKKRSIIIGSHIDTVRAGGRFDGIVGVISGLEVARRFYEKKITTLHPLEIVAFTAEEPSAFGISTVGSRAMAGLLSQEALNLREKKGRTLAQAISDIGGDPPNVSQAKRSSKDVLAYLELHIEQGPLLFSNKVPLGIVSGIVGIYRGKIEICGSNDHAGTTPMNKRKDALAAAAEVVLALETVCRKNEHVVGTIGQVNVQPNSLNVVPGTVNLGLDFRHNDEDEAKKILAEFENALKEIQQKRGFTINREIIKSSDLIYFEKKMIQYCKNACRQADTPYLETISWAGHDAMHIAKIAPTGMIFIPSKDGKSHCPEEFSDLKHIGLACEILATAVTSIDKEENH